MKMPDLINYIGLAIAVGVGALLGYGITKYAVSGKEYREKHRKELIRGIIEGLIFMMLGYMLYWGG